MVFLVLGGASSGKSSFAENVAVKLGKERYYIATMRSFGDEGAKRILRHQTQREGKGFVTCEISNCLENFTFQNPEVVLLECLSNLLANELFQDEKFNEGCLENICKGISYLKSISQNLIIVSSEIFSDGIKYDQESVTYIKYLGELNQFVANLSDVVVDVFYGIPQYLKGKEQSLCLNF